MIHLLMRKTASLFFRLISVFSPDKAAELRYFRLFKKRMNRSAPRTFAEKIMLWQSSEAAEQFAPYADKYLVRDYARQTIGDTYNLPLLAAYDHPRDIRWDEIPEGAYIKCNHASGYNLKHRKKRQAMEKTQVAWWYSLDFYKRHNERQYKPIRRKILIEQNVAGANTILWDYRYYVFHGRTAFVQIHNNRQKRFEVGPAYEPLPFRLSSMLTPIEEKAPEFDEMLKLAEKLAEPFPFVRVDFILADHRVYFCELTFSPGGGLRRFYPEAYNELFGDKLWN